MPLLRLTAEEQRAAISAASSDLKYHFAELGVEEDTQAALYHRGFTTTRLFAGIDESRVEVRDALTEEIGISRNDGGNARQQIALLLSAWEAARAQIEVEDKAKAERRLGQAARIVPPTDHQAMKIFAEAHLGKIRDSELPSKTFLASKQEQLEMGDPRAEDLREVLCIEDGELDMFAGIIEQGTGTLKIKQGKAQIPLPANAEDLRLRHRRIGITWLMLKSKHTNRPWLTDTVVDAFRRLSDYVLGKHVAGLRVQGNSWNKAPSWTLVLAFEHEIRKKMYQLIREQKAKDLIEAVEQATNMPELHNLYFLVPLTVTATNTTSDYSNVAAGDATGPTGKGAKSKGKGKGRKGKNGRLASTPDNKRICFRYNSGGCPGNCGYVHVCQLCLGSHSRKECKKRKLDTKA